MGGVTHDDTMHQLFERPPEHQWGFNRPEEIAAVSAYFGRPTASPHSKPSFPRRRVHVIGREPPQP